MGKYFIKHFIKQKYFIKLKDRPRPNWNGLMDQLISEKSEFTKQYHYNVTYNLLYITEQAKHLNSEIPPTNLCELKHWNSQN